MMIRLDAALGAEDRPRILLMGAHADDIEIGCGGTVIELLKRYPQAQITWVVFSANALRIKEARKAAKRLLRGARQPDIRVCEFRESFFPTQQSEIKAYFETLKPVRPHLVLVHYRDDLHQDHRVLGELAWNTFRDHLILEYEIPKYDGGLGSPQVFVPLSAATRKRKVDTLMSCFTSQASKAWFAPETFDGLMRIRGVECNAASGYAEAFYVRKLRLIG